MKGTPWCIFILFPKILALLYKILRYNPKICVISQNFAFASPAPAHRIRIVTVTGWQSSVVVISHLPLSNMLLVTGTGNSLLKVRIISRHSSGYRFSSNALNR